VGFFIEFFWTGGGYKNLGSTNKELKLRQIWSAGYNEKSVKLLPPDVTFQG